MSSVKRAFEQEKCAYCSSDIVEVMIQDNCSFSMCENQKCIYPFNEPTGIESFIKEVGYGNKKHKALTVANASLETAAANSVQSAKESFSQGLVLPPMTSSSEMQKDQNTSTSSNQQAAANPEEISDSSSRQNSNYSLIDIENILNCDDIYIDTDSITESIVQTPKDMIDANLFDGLDGFLVSTDNNTESKYNPFEGGDSELDSLLGI